jgi:hypothetical protein
VFSCRFFDHEALLAAKSIGGLFQSVKRYCAENPANIPAKYALTGKNAPPILQTVRMSKATSHPFNGLSGERERSDLQRFQFHECWIISFFSATK